MRQPCRKIRYFSRRAARQARRHIYAGHMQAYWCTRGCNAWHLGHLAPAILHGLRSKQEVYG
jgi:hypothetical protein